MPEYALILLGLFLVTFIIHRWSGVVIWRSFWHAFIVYGIVFVVAFCWDQFAIWRGHWSFGKQYLIGIYVGYMPIEEFGFIFIPSYFGLVLYKTVEKLLDKKHTS